MARLTLAGQVLVHLYRPHGHGFKVDGAQLQIDGLQGEGAAVALHDDDTVESPARLLRSRRAVPTPMPPARVPWVATGVSVSSILYILPSRFLGAERQLQPRDFGDEAYLLRSMVNMLEPRYFQLTTGHPGMPRLDESNAFGDGEVHPFWDDGSKGVGQNGHADGSTKLSHVVPASQ